MQTYPQIIELWAFIELYSTNICCDICVAYEFFYFFWNVFNSKAIKVCYIVSCTPIITIRYEAIQ